MAAKVKRVPNPRRLCIFCNGGRPSGEHLFSDWISKVIATIGERHWHWVTRFQSPGVLGTPSQRRREGDILSLKLKVVCRSCNSGWMGMMDTAAIPIVTPLILGERIVLTPEQQNILATWITLKTIVGEHDEIASAAIPPQSAIEFYRSKTPLNGSKIWIGTYEGTEWCQTARYLHIGSSFKVDTPKLGVIRHRIYKMQTTTFTIGKLYIHVFSSTLDPCFYGFRGRTATLLSQILPPVGQPLQWPRTVLIQDADAHATAVSLAARHGSHYQRLKSFVPTALAKLPP